MKYRGYSKKIGKKNNFLVKNSPKIPIFDGKSAKILKILIYWTENTLQITFIITSLQLYRLQPFKASEKLQRLIISNKLHCLTKISNFSIFFHFCQIIRTKNVIILVLIDIFTSSKKQNKFQIVGNDLNYISLDYHERKPISKLLQYIEPLFSDF